MDKNFRENKSKTQEIRITILKIKHKDLHYQFFINKKWLTFIDPYAN